MKRGRLNIKVTLSTVDGQILRHRRLAACLRHRYMQNDGWGTFVTNTRLKMGKS